MKKKLIFAFAFFLIFSQVFAQSAQNRNFPAGSVDGRTEMDLNASELSVPNVSINITSPQTGREVAFSIRLLLLMTILTLAPSLLILLTCFLRFSIFFVFFKMALSLFHFPSFIFFFPYSFCVRRGS